MQSIQLSPTNTNHPTKDTTDVLTPTNDTTTQPLAVAQKALTVVPQASDSEINSPCYIKFAKGLTRVLSFLGATALGVFTGLAIMGTLVTPIGWGIAGATLIIGLAGSLYFGGKKEFLTNLQISISSFASGLGVGLTLGTFFAAKAAGLTVGEVGGKAIMAYFGGFILYVGSLISAAHTISTSSLD